MKAFQESLRYDYPLNAGSMVLDFGGYHGQWAAAMIRRYRCTLMAFEPVKRLFAIMDAEINKTSKEVSSNCLSINAGIGATSRTEKLAVRNDSSSIFRPSDEMEEVAIVGIKEMLDAFGRGEIDLAKFNIEGMEYEALEAIIGGGFARRFRNLQVQFHDCVPDAPARREAIRIGLSATHHLTYDEPFVWENWERNE